MNTSAMWPVNDLLTLFRLTWIELPAFGIIDVSFMETRCRIAIIPLFSIHYTDYNLIKLNSYCHWTSSDRASENISPTDCLRRSGISCGDFYRQERQSWKKALSFNSTGMYTGQQLFYIYYVSFYFVNHKNQENVTLVCFCIALNRRDNCRFFSWGKICKFIKK